MDPLLGTVPKSYSADATVLRVGLGHLCVKPFSGCHHLQNDVQVPRWDAKAPGEVAAALLSSLPVYHSASIRSCSCYRMNFFHFLRTACPPSILGPSTCVLFLLFLPNSLLICLRYQFHCHRLGPSLSPALFLLLSVGLAGWSSHSAVNPPPPPLNQLCSHSSSSHFFSLRISE